MQNLWIQEASKSRWFATKKVDTSVNLADLVTKPIPKAGIEQLISLTEYEFVSAETSASRGQATITQEYCRQEGIPVPRQSCISVECQWDIGDETDIDE